MNGDLSRGKINLPSKVSELVRLAENYGWEAKAVAANLFKGTREKWLPAAQFVARRGPGLVTMTWVDGAALGPIGWYAHPGGLEPVEDRADARRILTADH